MPSLCTLTTIQDVKDLTVTKGKLALQTLTYQQPKFYLQTDTAHEIGEGDLVLQKKRIVRPNVTAICPCLILKRMESGDFNERSGFSIIPTSLYQVLCEIFIVEVLLLVPTSRI